MIFFTRTVFIVITACFGLPGCAVVLLFFDSDVTKDPRFENAVGRELHARKKLYLFERSGGQPATQRCFYDLMDSMGSHEPLIAVVPAGHPVKFNKVLRQNLPDDGEEHLCGEITIKGKTYPIKFLVGFTSLPNQWREIFNTFDIRQPSSLDGQSKLTR